jgi:hypothetical protein
MLLSLGMTNEGLTMTAETLTAMNKRAFLLWAADQTAEKARQHRVAQEEASTASLAAEWRNIARKAEKRAERLREMAGAA